jgi:hypothetical protein
LTACSTPSSTTNGTEIGLAVDSVSIRVWRAASPQFVWLLLWKLESQIGLLEPLYPAFRFAQIKTTEFLVASSRICSLLGLLCPSLFSCFIVWIPNCSALLLICPRIRGLFLNLQTPFLLFYFSSLLLGLLHSGFGFVWLVSAIFLIYQSLSLLLFGAASTPSNALGLGWICCGGRSKRWSSSSRRTSRTSSSTGLSRTPSDGYCLHTQDANLDCFMRI